MVGVDVGCHQHLEVRELPLGQLQADGVGFLGRQVVLLAEGLDEVVVLPPVCFPKPLLGELHFREGRLGGAVPAAHQPLSFPQRLFLLLGVPQHSSERTPAAAPVLDGGEGSHLRSPPAGVGGVLARSAVALRQPVSVHDGDLAHVGQGGELVEIPPLGFQLGQHLVQTFHPDDLLAQTAQAQVVGDGQPQLLGLGPDDGLWCGVSPAG